MAFAPPVRLRRLPGCGNHDTEVASAVGETFVVGDERGEVPSTGEEMVGGGQVDCGTCPNGQLCGVNTPYQCGPAPVCTPATCQSLGANCGLVGDGCGALLDCGVCPAGFTCGLGQANVCAQIR